MPSNDSAMTFSRQDRGVVLPKTHYSRISKEEQLTLGLDGGNDLFKSMIGTAKEGHFGEERVMPHSVRRLSEGEWEALAAQLTNQAVRFDGSALFKLNGVPYLAGKQAQGNHGIRLIGAEKYIKGHYDVLMVAALLQHYPESHSQVRVLALHPAKISAAHIAMLKDVVGGTFEIELPNGTHITYKVKWIIPLAEAVGGLQTLMLSNTGRTVEKPRLSIRRGDQFLVVDIGGGICSVVPCELSLSGEINVDRLAAESVKFGIQQVTEHLDLRLRDEFDELKPLQSIPASMTNQALMTKTIDIGSRRNLDCAKCVFDAFDAILPELRSVYVNKFNRGVNVAAIPVSGGGGLIALPYIKDTIFKDRLVIEVEQNPDMAVFSNLRGIFKGFLAKNLTR